LAHVRGRRQSEPEEKAALARAILVVDVSLSMSNKPLVPAIAARLASAPPPSIWEWATTLEPSTTNVLAHARGAAGPESMFRGGENPAVLETFLRSLPPQSMATLITDRSGLETLQKSGLRVEAGSVEEVRGRFADVDLELVVL